MHPSDVVSFDTPPSEFGRLCTLVDPEWRGHPKDK